MRLTIILVLAISLLMQPMAMAQQAGENINVLPVVFPSETDWQLKGDGYLQRQVEPSIAASTRNPDHLVAFFNDYRAVDIADDIGLGEGAVMIAMFNTTRTIMMAVSQLSFPKLPHMELPPIAASEAWIGMSRSYDGGLTWSGGFLPGASFDTGHDPDLITPIDGLEAATDPVLAPGPCGKFYLVFMAFTRGGESKLVVTRYQDHNYAGGGEHIQWDGFMTVAESGNNAEYGYFLDKPDIEVDIARYSGADICADQVNISYSTFNGLTNDGKFQSKINFAYSTDSAETFTKQKLNPPYKQNQGSALAINPIDGTIYMIWRHFNDPDAILMTSSENHGVKWSKPVVVTGDAPMAAFDQPSISVAAALPDPPAQQYTSPINPGFPEVAFRSNGFPTAAVTAEGKLFVAWQERVNEYGEPSQLITDPPRIMVVHSDDKGDTWRNTDGYEATRKAVDMGDRDADSSAYPTPGFGTLPQHRPSGPQAQPKLVYSGGQLLLTYYESHGRIYNYGSGAAYVPSGLPYEGIIYEDHGGFVPPGIPQTPYMSGYDRVIDFRAALLDPTDGNLLTPGSTIQVSRYPIRAGADFSNGEDFMDVAPVNPPCYPDDAAGIRPCIRQVNRANATQSSWGGIPFIGDYPDVAPIVQFVYAQDPVTLQWAWRWATDPEDVPFQGFHTIFTDNRHLLPATQDENGNPSDEPEWVLSQYYNPPFESLPNNPPGCTNAGSRNTDVLTSRIDSRLVLNAPTTFKDLDNDQRGFPFTIKNSTAESRSYHLQILGEPSGASFNRLTPGVYGGTVEIFGYSSGSFMVYIDADFSDPVSVRVTEDCTIPDPSTGNCPTGVLTFNVDSGYDQTPAVGGPDTQVPWLVQGPDYAVVGDSGDPENPFVINPFVINPFVINPFVINPFVINPFVINPFVINPFVINTSPDDIQAVIDTTWTVSAGDSSTASSYLPLVNIDNAQAFLDSGYSFQLIVHKGALYGGLTDCGSTNVGQPQILANVYPGSNNQNPFVINPFVINPFVINPFVINPFVINSTFTMAPTDDSPDGTTKAPPATDEVNITLRAFKLKPDKEWVTQSNSATGGEAPPTKHLKTTLVYQPWDDPPSLVIVPLPCDTSDPDNVCFVTQAPDLIPDGFTVTEALTAPVGGTLTGFPDIDWYVENHGYGDATAENGPLQHGFYLCGTVPAQGTGLDPATCVAITEMVLSTKNPLTNDPGGAPDPENYENREYFAPVELTIPDAPYVSPGLWQLVVYADDTMEVSEFNEHNNWVAFPITIEEPNESPTVDMTHHGIDEDTSPPANLASDLDDDPLTITITSGPTNGTLNTTNGVVDSSDGSFVYTPFTNFNGEDSFDFEVSDGMAIVGGTVEITVTPVNDPPEMDDLSVEMNEDFSVQGSLGAIDADGDPLTYSVLTSPTLGILEFDGSTGTFTYTPNPDENGTHTFGVEVTDGLLTDSATVTIVITAVNDAPVAEDYQDTMPENSSISGQLIGNDVDLDPLNFLLVSVASHGTAVVDPDGAFTYTPTPGYIGVDSFGFEVSDGIEAASGEATITVVDATSDWLFIGFDSPWGPYYAINAGSAIPLKWHYADPDTGQTIPSFYEDLPITATGYDSCELDPNGDPAGILITDPPLTLPDKDAGSSSLRYVNGDWQLNWDTVGLEPGCYFLSIHHTTTHQTDEQNANGERLAIVLQ